jgi:hypothetical protein
VLQLGGVSPETSNVAFLYLSFDLSSRLFYNNKPMIMPRTRTTKKKKNDTAYRPPYRIDPEAAAIRALPPPCHVPHTGFPSAPSTIRIPPQLNPNPVKLPQPKGKTDAVFGGNRSWDGAVTTGNYSTSSTAVHFSDQVSTEIGYLSFGIGFRLRRVSSRRN